MRINVWWQLQLVRFCLKTEGTKHWDGSRMYSGDCYINMAWAPVWMWGPSAGPSCGTNLQSTDDPLATASYGYILPMIWPTPLSIKSPNRKQFDQRVGILERFFSALTCAAAARRCSGCGNQRWRQSGRAAASCRGSTTPPRCQCRSRTGACTAGVSFCYRAATTMCCCTSTAYSTYAVHVHALRTPQKTYVYFRELAIKF